MILYFLFILNVDLCN